MRFTPATAVLFILCFVAQVAPGAQGEAAKRPTMAEFMGINGHTVQFRPELYAPVCRRVRDYHPVDWDVAGDPARATRFPMAANGVDWTAVYGSWLKAGFETDVCLQLESLPATAWKDPVHDAEAYGRAFAQEFGPSSARKLVSSVEIGNEPAKYTPEQYRTIFQAMARGVREGDPRLLIATCAVMTGKPDEWSKPVSVLNGCEDLYDVLNVHSYAFASGWPSWKRSYPEDPSIDHLKQIQSLIAWRDEHAKGKPIWLTEFGYDSATHPPAADGPWSKWQGVSDSEQARYVVRSFLTFSSMDIDRAYLYFFNDDDAAQLHGASGITRHFKPKPAYYAMRQLFQNLGDYRFEKATRRDAEMCVFSFICSHFPGKRVSVAWLPMGPARDATTMKAGTIRLGRSTVANGLDHVERMVQSDHENPRVTPDVNGDGSVTIGVSDTPVYLFWK